MRRRLGRPLADRLIHYGKRLAVLLSDEQFDLVEPLLELPQEGALIAPALKSKEDFELERALAEDREPSEGEDAQIGELLRRSGPQP